MESVQCPPIPETLARRSAPLFVALLLACCGQAKQEAAPPPAQVTITAVAFKELRQWDDFTGRLEAIDTVEIRPRVGGYIDGARFEEGARVRKGQVLFQIDPRPYQAEANRAEAEVARAKAQLDLAAVNRERGRRLIEQNALAQSEFDRLLRGREGRPGQSSAPPTPPTRPPA